MAEYAVAVRVWKVSKRIKLPMIRKKYAVSPSPLGIENTPQKESAII